MASVSTILQNATTAGMSEELRLREATSPLPGKDTDERDGLPRLGRATEPIIDQTEKGDAEAMDQHGGSGALDDIGSDPQAAAAVRKQVAGSLAQAIARVIAACGSAKMPAQLHLLKRELSGCHEVLGSLSTETDFLSIVTLIEMDLGTRDWKTITKDELRALQRAVKVGIDQSLVSFDDYELVLRTLHSSGYTPGPAMHLDDSQLPIIEDFDASPNA